MLFAAGPLAAPLRLRPQQQCFVVSTVHCVPRFEESAVAAFGECAEEGAGENRREGHVDTEQEWGWGLSVRSRSRHGHGGRMGPDRTNPADPSMGTGYGVGWGGCSGYLSRGLGWERSQPQDGS